MPPELERALLLTLASLEAVRHERWDEAAQLLMERGTALDRLQKAPPGGDPAAWDRLADADQRLGQAMLDARAEIVDQIARAHRGRQVAPTYSSKPQAPAFEQVG